MYYLISVVINKKLEGLVVYRDIRPGLLDFFRSLKPLSETDKNCGYQSVVEKKISTRYDRE